MQHKNKDASARQPWSWLASGLVVMVPTVGLTLPLSPPNASVAVAQSARTPEADQLFQQATQLFQEGSADSLHRATRLLERASQLYQAAGQHGKTALTLLALGRVHSALGEQQLALDYYSKALTLWQALDNQSGKATTLNNIGRVYSDLGRKQQALDYYNQALLIRRTVGDRAGEAASLNNIGQVYSVLGEKQQALDYFNQALPLWQAVGDQAGEASTLNNIGQVYAALGEKQQALDYYKQALPLWQTVGNRAGEAASLNNIGQVYTVLGEKPQALEYYNQALPLWRAIGDRAGEATTLNNVGQVYAALGEKQQALGYYNQALLLSQAVGDRAGEAATLNNIGTVYNALGEKQQALDYFNQSLPLRQAVGDRAGEAATLNNIGAVYNDLGKKQQALHYYNQALSIFQVVGDRVGEATTLNNIGGVYFDFGEQQQALDYYNQALLLSQAVGDRAGEAKTLNNIGTVYNALGEKQQALDYFNQSLPLRQAVGDRAGEATTLHNIGAVYNDLGEKQQALDYYNQALSISQAVGDRAGEAATLNNIGTVYDAFGEKQQALDYFNQALLLSQAVGDRTGAAAILNNIGGVYFDFGEEQQALNYYNQALTLRQTVGDRVGEAATLSNIGVIYRSQGKLEEALNSIDSAIAIVEDLRTKIGSDELRASYFATVQGYYQFKINLLMQLQRDREAFETSEAARGRVLLELLNASNIDIRRGVDPKLLAQEQEQRLALQAIEQQRLQVLSQNYTPAAAEALDQRSDAALKDLEQTLAQIRKASPAYAELKQPQPLSLSQIRQQVLDPETVLLQYSLGENQSYLWIVSQQEFKSYVLPGRATIAKALKTFRNVLSTGGNIDSDVKRTGGQLLALILPERPDWLAGKRLLVVADGDLQTIPFGALPLPNQEKYVPLLTQHEILSQPSASAIAVLRQQVKGRFLAPKTLAVLADPVYRADDNRVNQTVAANLPAELQSNLRSLDLRVISRLPNTRSEADSILGLVSPQNRLAAYDFDATFDWLKQPQLRQYRIVHLATHGFVNPTNPQLSGIVLALVNPQGQLLDKGFLRLHDIFNLDLRAELIVLSACQTGLGEQVSGEGLVGLTRGFMYAGGKRLVVSLWNVDDKATAQLMKGFYQRMLQQGMSPSAALRATQQAAWNSGQAPRLWAAFIAQGEWQR